jgi:hypothetical protein
VCLRRWLGVGNQAGRFPVEVLSSKATQLSGRKAPHLACIQPGPCFSRFGLAISEAETFLAKASTSVAALLLERCEHWPTRGRCSAQWQPKAHVFVTGQALLRAPRVNSYKKLQCGYWNDALSCRLVQLRIWASRLGPHRAKGCDLPG